MHEVKHLFLLQWWRKTFCWRMKTFYPKYITRRKEYRNIIWQISVNKLERSVRKKLLTSCSVKPHATIFYCNLHLSWWWHMHMPYFFCIKPDISCCLLVWLPSYKYKPLKKSCRPCDISKLYIKNNKIYDQVFLLICIGINKL